MKTKREIAVRLFAGAALAMSMGFTGCGGGKDENRKPALSETQRDSVIARSKLPGSGVMGKTLAVSDSAAARAKRLNAMSGGQ